MKEQKGAKYVKFELQIANMWKRISAFILDMILLCIAATGAMYALSAITGYDAYSEQLNAYYAQYEKEYGIETFDITEDEYLGLSDEARAQYDEAYGALTQDEKVLHTYSMVVNLTTLITSLSFFIAFALLEFAVPLLLGNGQTVGKKIFGLGVIRCDGVKVNAFMLFVRTLLGKFTIETMIPIMLFVMLIFGIVGVMGPIVIILILLLQIILLLVTKNRTVIHDAFAQTVVIDLASQLVFDTPEALQAYKKKLAGEEVARAEY